MNEWNRAEIEDIYETVIALCHLLADKKNCRSQLVRYVCSIFESYFMLEQLY